MLKNYGILLHMIIHELHDLSNSKAVALMEKEFSTISDMNLIENYHPDFKNNPSNIFYILKNGRYHLNNGSYWVIEEDGNFSLSSGWNVYELEEDTALALTRTWGNPRYRRKYYMSKYLLPLMIEQASAYKNLYITVNDYNYRIYRMFERANVGKNSGLDPIWFDIYKNFEPIGKKTIYYTEQWVVRYKHV